MKINTVQFGEVEINEDDIITFPKGIIGFPKYNKYVLLNADESGESPFLFLQSVEEPELDFLILNVFKHYPQYDFDMNESLVAEIELEGPKDAFVCTIVTVRDTLANATTNLKAPVVINQTKKIGVQFVLDNKRYEIKHPITEGLLQKTGGEH
ncbi:flagellar assembly protein FliW [Niallia taxi]|uniref:flagellar assembly protein FliW n=1 Tax=Niallia taxi TaxID=2499688 RepID=UPI0015F5A78B|nr:flagellar assembly protein FliW [Niallia taxi]